MKRTSVQVIRIHFQLKIILCSIDRKRPRSTSTGSSRDIKSTNYGFLSLPQSKDFHLDKQEKRLSSSSPWIRKDSTKISKPIDEDEHDSSSSTRPNRKSIITTRSQAAIARGLSIHRRKSSPPKKRSPVGLTSHRANTRIHRKSIEQDLELLRQAQPLDLSNRINSLDESTEKTSTPEILDLSLSSR